MIILNKLKISLVDFLLISVLSVTTLVGQDVADPLTIQGIEHEVVTGARIISMGGTTMHHNPSNNVLHSHPAMLTQLLNSEINIVGSWHNQKFEQNQTWIPNRLYAELSLVFKNEETFTQEQFDNIRPNWVNEKNQINLPSITVTYPFQLFDRQIVVGIGFSEQNSLKHYYQNNNALDPNIGRLRPEPIPRLEREDTLHVNWYQFTRQREGEIYSLTPAVGTEIIPNLSLGFSTNILFGSSDDFQRRFDRGLLELRYENDFSLFQRDFSQTLEGKSDYSGIIFKSGLAYILDNFGLNFTVQFPYTLTRDWSLNKIIQNEGTVTEELSNGSDYLKFPFQYKIGVGFFPSQNLSIGLEALLANLDQVEFQSESTGNEEINPWIGSTELRGGIQYQLISWLALRAGYRENVQVFAPAGHSLMDQPARGEIYSGGLGFKFFEIELDLAFEQTRLNYVDRWLSNTNENKQIINRFVIETLISF